MGTFQKGQNTMGLLRYLFGNDEYADNYENGVDWAETLIDVDANVSPMQAERMAQDLSSDPYAFYDGFRSEWNAQPDIEPERGFFSRLIFRG
jgi:hypothetical protein